MPENEKTIGETIRERRLRKGYTQDALAAELHVSPQAISKWENGQTMPDINLLLPLSRVLEISVNELLGGDRRRALVQKWRDAEDLDEEMALLAIDDALVEFPDDEEFLYHRAKYEYTIGERAEAGSEPRIRFLSDAILHLEELVEKYPENDGYKSLLASSYFALDRKQDALRTAYSIKNGRDQLDCVEKFMNGEDKRKLRQNGLKSTLHGMLIQLRRYNTRESIEAAYAVLDVMASGDKNLRALYIWPICVADALLCLDEGNLDRYVAKLTEAYEVVREYDDIWWEKIEYKSPFFDLLSIERHQRYPYETGKLIKRFLDEPKLVHPVTAELRRRIAKECFVNAPLIPFRWKNYYRFCRKYICRGNYFNFGTAWHVPCDEERAKFNALKQVSRRGSVALHEIHKDEIERYVKSGVMQGFTASHYEEIIAFCHSGRKEKFERLTIPEEERAIPTAPEGSKVFSIVEVLVADSFKGCGVEEALITDALETAKRKGYTHAEVYPMERMAFPDGRFFYTLLEVYKKLGFKIIRDFSSETQGKYYIMQKELISQKPKNNDRKDPTDEYNSILKELGKQGYEIAPALTDAEREDIEKEYDIRFPRALRDFFACGFPVGKEPRGDFPLWKNRGAENVSIIERRLGSPLECLTLDVKGGFWLEAWGERPKDDDEALAKFSEIAEKAPKLIPICSHRYLPVIDGVDDPPVISTVGRDTIYYGCNLSGYLKREFLKFKEPLDYGSITRIPFWSDIIEDQG